MITLDELDCKVFVESPLPLAEFGELLAERIEATFEGERFAVTLRVPGVEMEIRENEDAALGRVSEFPDGFLYFRYFLEVYADSSATESQRISLVAEILKSCWNLGWSAVAASDYENNLPENGGYKSLRIPWPGKLLAAPSRQPTTQIPDFPTQPGAQATVDK